MGLRSYGRHEMGGGAEGGLDQDRVVLNAKQEAEEVGGILGRLIGRRVNKAYPPEDGIQAMILMDSEGVRVELAHAGEKNEAFFVDFSPVGELRGNLFWARVTQADKRGMERSWELGEALGFEEKFLFSLTKTQFACDNETVLVRGREYPRIYMSPTALTVNVGWFGVVAHEMGHAMQEKAEKGELQLEEDAWQRALSAGDRVIERCENQFLSFVVEGGVRMDRILVLAMLGLASYGQEEALRASPQSVNLDVSALYKEAEERFERLVAPLLT